MLDDSATRHVAYRDGPLPIGWSQTISQAYVVAWMTELPDLAATAAKRAIVMAAGRRVDPFDRISLTAVPPEIPPALVEQLAQGGNVGGIRFVPMVPAPV